MPKILATQALYEGWGRFLKVRLQADGEEIEREVEDHGPAATVLPYDAERRTALLVRQFRPPAFVATGAATVLETIAGRLDGDDPETCARREAMEEAGVRLAVLEPAGVYWPLPGISTEVLHAFLAPYSQQDRVAAGGGLAHEGETITVEEIALDRLAAMVEHDRVVDLKARLLVEILRGRRPELFV